MEEYAQTGFQSACAEFAEDRLSLDSRYGISNPSLISITLPSAAPLFGINKDDKILVDMSRKPRNGDLVLVSEGDSQGVFRYETASGVPTLWPGNKSLKEDNPIVAYVVILLIKEFA